MRKLLSIGFVFALVAAPVVSARADNDKETDRMEVALREVTFTDRSVMRTRAGKVLSANMFLA